jgi:hypothetical protein
VVQLSGGCWRGVLGAVNLTERWVSMVPNEPQLAEASEGFCEARCIGVRVDICGVGGALRLVNALRRSASAAASCAR